MLEQAQNIYFRHVWGITREYSELRWSGATGLLLFSMFDERKYQPEYRGELPPVGKGGIIVANHGSDLDPKMAVIAFRKFGRTIQCFVRNSLLDTNIKEDPAILAATGKEKNDLDNKPIVYRKVRAKFMKDVGSIGIPRGAAIPLKTVRYTLARIDANILVASFLQQTRIPESDLRDLFEGAAFLAYQRPDALIIPIGISYNPNLFNIGDWLTYREAKREKGFDIPNLGETQRLTVCMANHVAPLLPSELTDRWFDGQRKESIDGFKAKNEAAIQLRKERLRVKREINPQN